MDINPDFSVRVDDGSGYRSVLVQDIVDVCFVQFSMEGSVRLEIDSNRMTIRNVKVMSNLRYYGDVKINTDGINPNKCRHVLVDDCLIWSGDDAIAIKNGTTYDDVFPFRDVFDHTYSDITVFTRRNAARIGSETQGIGKKMSNLLISVQKNLHQKEVHLREMTWAIQSKEFRYCLWTIPWLTFSLMRIR